MKSVGSRNYQMAFAARRQGKTRGAIGFSLIFCFFCIKAKEKAKAFDEPEQFGKVF
ncbi:MAG TPA: hypothetical protein VLS85_07470 [Hanamia sp.]|nr:hypothetical protein [Hanamia sp.]